MNPQALALLIAAISVSAIDWFAVSRKNKPLEYVCKPLATALFLASAIALDTADDGARVSLAVALVFCLAGDVFLMLPRDAFVPGLGSFAVAQILFTVSFAVREISTFRLVVGFVIVVAGTALLGRRFISALGKANEPGLVVPVAMYMTVIAAMVVSSIATGTAVAIVGAILFMISDSLIAEERFVRHRPWQPMTVIVTYHTALAGLVLGLV